MIGTTRPIRHMIFGGLGGRSARSAANTSTPTDGAVLALQRDGVGEDRVVGAVAGQVGDHQRVGQMRRQQVVAFEPHPVAAARWLQRWGWPVR